MGRLPFSRTNLLIVITLAAAQTACGPAIAQSNMQQMLDSIDPNAASRLAPVPPAVQQLSVQQTQTLPSSMPQPAGPGPMQMLRSMFNGDSPQMQQAAPPVQRKPSMFQTLFGDGGGPGDTTGSARENMHRAENQASYAREACSRSYHGDHWTRSQAADDAYNAAEEARYEADAAAAKVGVAGADANNQEYASNARTYAERAQASSDTARANADRVWK